jgi:hypothetical protein
MHCGKMQRLNPNKAQSDFGSDTTLLDDIGADHMLTDDSKLERAYSPTE